MVMKQLVYKTEKFFLYIVLSCLLGFTGMHAAQPPQIQAQAQITQSAPGTPAVTVGSQQQGQQQDVGTAPGAQGQPALGTAQAVPGTEAGTEGQPVGPDGQPAGTTQPVVPEEQQPPEQQPQEEQPQEEEQGIIGKAAGLVSGLAGSGAGMMALQFLPIGSMVGGIKNAATSAYSSLAGKLSGDVGKKTASQLESLQKDYATAANNTQLPALQRQHAQAAAAQLKVAALEKKAAENPDSVSQAEYTAATTAAKERTAAFQTALQPHIAANPNNPELKAALDVTTKSTSSLASAQKALGTHVGGLTVGQHAIVRSVAETTHEKTAAALATAKQEMTEADKGQAAAQAALATAQREAELKSEAAAALTTGEKRTEADKAAAEAHYAIKEKAAALQKAEIALQTKQAEHAAAEATHQEATEALQGVKEIPSPAAQISSLTSTPQSTPSTSGIGGSLATGLKSVAGKASGLASTVSTKFGALSKGQKIGVGVGVVAGLAAIAAATSAGVYFGAIHTQFIVPSDDMRMEKNIEYDVHVSYAAGAYTDFKLSFVNGVPVCREYDKNKNFKSAKDTDVSVTSVNDAGKTVSVIKVTRHVWCVESVKVTNTKNPSDTKTISVPLGSNRCKSHAYGLGRDENGTLTLTLQDIPGKN